MNFVCRLLIIFAALLGISQSAQASIVASVLQGSSVILNFDFTGQTPPPPYTSVSVDWSLDGVLNDVQTDIGIITIFSELNGTGSILNTGSWDDTSYWSGQGNPSFNDGVFSMVFSSVEGDMNIASATAMATSSEGRVSISPTVGGSIPEPTSIALVGLGLAGLGWGRKRRFPKTI
ncbi:MAG: hypothetical protein CVU32_03700 [Betaproteobacteria bacterium HGW-Betaproteobacteria-5]|jgi:hypothetical protein|nr:MAG: hypothetical protein CVU32_03700 [Betaproteobacteria bacterium HGW-Betaproteobacteria-5]PKO36474.1 MAG: hypothetical protein CVU33_18265 [Betaproteobacteria bacterium HGW-Betaproteobacteria-6]